MRYVVLSTTVCLVALAQTALAGVYTTTDSSLAMSPIAAEESVLPELSNFASSSPPKTGLAETGERLAGPVIQPTDIPQASRVVQADGHSGLQSIQKTEKTIEQRLAETERNWSGFSLDGLFSGTGETDSSLVSLFLGMTIIGLIVGGIRLEILRRRAEEDAFYGVESGQHRSHVQRITVIYIEKPRRSRSSCTSSGSSHRRRRRRRRSSHGEHGNSERRRRSSYRSTHPVTVEGRLVG